MKIIESKATIKNGQIILDKTCEKLPNNQEVEVVIIFKEKYQQ